MGDKQQTISKEIELKGIGLHTGQEVNVKFLPAEENHGVKFQRTDIEGLPTIDALIDNVVDIKRGTTIGNNITKISTIEHTLAALVGLKIDNILIQLDADEMPIMDGSSAPFIKVFLNAGIEKQEALRDYIIIKDEIQFKDEENKIELTITPSDRFCIDVVVDYNSNVLGTQFASLNDLEKFQKEISSCRTFCFLHEIEPLFEQGLIKGGDLDNAIVIVDEIEPDEKLKKLETLFNKKEIRVEKTGILNNIDLRFENEIARHKLLDVIGDLALLGKPIKGKVFAARPGHKSNIELAKLIQKKEKRRRKKILPPQIDINQTPILTSTEVYEALPHEHPFKLVDKILHLDSTSVIGTKNITIDEPFFTGHFPKNPVFPGVLQLETIAQVGGIFVLTTVPDPDNYWTYLMGFEKCKFRKMVTPGDTLLMKCELLEPIRRGLARMQGLAFVGDDLVCETEILASIVKKS